MYKNETIDVHCRKLKGKILKSMEKDVKLITYPGLTPQTSVNTRFKSLESVAIATASSVNESPARLVFLVEVESFSKTGRARTTFNWFFTDCCIIIINNVTLKFVSLFR